MGIQYSLLFPPAGVVAQRTVYVPGGGDLSTVPHRAGERLKCVTNVSEEWHTCVYRGSILVESAARTSGGSVL